MRADLSNAEARRVPLEGVFNARDLGGIPTTDGNVVRSGLIYRMDSPQFLSAAAARELIDERQLRTVLDLRYPRESTEQGIGDLAEQGLRHINVPIISSDRQTAPGLRQMVEAAQGRPIADVTAEYYQGYFTAANGAGIVTAVRDLADPANLPSLVHCAAGKDRTGAVVAMVLSVVGVADDVICADYAASASAAADIVRRLHSLGTYVNIDETTIDMQTPRYETMEQLMAWIRSSFGSPLEFLLERGMPQAEIETLKQTLVAPARSESPR